MGISQQKVKLVVLKKLLKIELSSFQHLKANIYPQVTDFYLD